MESPHLRAGPPPSASSPAANRSRWLANPLARFFIRRIQHKIAVPYLVLISLVAVLAVYLATDAIDSALEQKFLEELAAAGRSANESMVLIESQNLRLLRQIVFTEGVQDSIERGDSAALRRLIGPSAVNSRVQYVDVLAGDGVELLALRPTAGGVDPAALMDPDVATWEPVRRALQGDTDTIGDRHAGFVVSRSGRLFVSAAPVWSGDEVIGVVAVGVPIEEVTSRLSQEAHAKGITLYGMDGQPLASTVRTALGTLAVSADLARVAAAPGQVLNRRVQLPDATYAETLSVLAVRREPALILGVGNVINIIFERGEQMRLTMIAVFIALFLAVMGIGLAVARSINRPIFQLLEATRHIRANDLDYEVPVETEDEHGILAEAFNDMRIPLKERARAQSAIESYMSPKVYQLIQRDELKIGGQRREITVFKTDIRDFTTFSEKMDSEALVKFLNRYLERMVEPIAKYDGEVDKYMGDAILAKFGATESYPEDDHAERAVLTMIEMIEACDRLNEEFRREGLPIIRMGIGCNTGEAVVGNIGSAQRMEYTIISDAVNTAQRIEDLCKVFGWDLLISEQTYEQARTVVDVGDPWTASLRGKTRDTLVYPVLGRKGAVPAARLHSYEALTAIRPTTGGSSL